MALALILSEKFIDDGFYRDEKFGLRFAQGSVRKFFVYLATNRIELCLKSTDSVFF